MNWEIHEEIDIYQGDRLEPIGGKLSGFLRRRLRVKCGAKRTNPYWEAQLFLLPPFLGF